MSTTDPIASAIADLRAARERLERVLTNRTAPTHTTKEPNP